MYVLMTHESPFSVFSLRRVLRRSWLSLTVLLTSRACFPSSTPLPCFPSPERTMLDSRSSSREPPRKRLPLKHRSPPRPSAPAFPLWTKQALTSSTATTRRLPRLQRHRSASQASIRLHGSPSGRCINMWPLLTHSVHLMAEQQGSHLRQWPCRRTLTRSMLPQFLHILQRPTSLESHQLQAPSWLYPKYLSQLCLRLRQQQQLLKWENQLKLTPVSDLLQLKRPHSQNTV